MRSNEKLVIFAQKTDEYENIDPNAPHTHGRVLMVEESVRRGTHIMLEIRDDDIGADRLESNIEMTV